MAATKVMSCSCLHEGQDKLYGKQKRLCNPTKKGVGETIKYRCTVCKDVK